MGSTILWKAERLQALISSSRQSHWLTTMEGGINQLILCLVRMHAGNFRSIVLPKDIFTWEGAGEQTDNPGISKQASPEP